MHCRIKPGLKLRILTKSQGFSGKDLAMILGLLAKIPRLQCKILAKIFPLGREEAVHCNGTETSLSQWSHSETTTGVPMPLMLLWSADRVGVSDGDVRLVGSPINGQGAVEIVVSSVSHRMDIQLCLCGVSEVGVQ
ncbi:hypothetical protein EMCRGX_G015227 [Ephydatia muelleri]